jgi:ABC-type bacteriocin/lantibiotic exporter with double-glycine peptidase domain
MKNPAGKRRNPAQEKSWEAALLSIGFFMDMVDRVQWRCGGGRGPWEACLAALVLAFDPGCKPRRLLEALPARKNMDQVAFMNTMANLGYFTNEIDMALKDVEPRLLPCLFVQKGQENAPCVLLSREAESFTLYDSVSHKIVTLPLTDVRGGIAGQVFFFLPYDRHRQQTSRFMRGGTGRSWFFAILERFSGTFRQILLTCFVLNLFALAPSLFVMLVYDRIISPADLSGLPALAAGVALALGAEYFLRNVRAEGLAWMTARLDNLVGGRIFDHLIGLAPELIEQASVAAQVARIRTFESVRDFFSSAVFLSFLEIPFVLIAAAVMAAIAGPLVLVPFAMIGVYAALFFFMRHKIKTAIRLSAKASSARQQFTIETFEKLRSLRLNGLAGAWGRKFEELSGREILMNLHLGFLGTVAETLAHGLTILAAMLTVGCGVHLIWAGEMTTGALVASMILVWRILLPFYSLCTMIPRLEQLRNSILQVNSLMELETETDDAQAAAVLPALHGRIALENAVLGYEEGADPVIAGLTLHMSPGQIAAVMGRNGTGKTSLLKMVKGMYRPQTGALRIDGFDSRQLDPVMLRRQIAYVPQHAEFFPGTVADNLVIGNPFAALEDIEAALRRADAYDDIMALPKGLATRVGRGLFSAALATKISLARAYLQNAPVLLIDELPNAVMNGAAGRNLKDYLQQTRARRTAIVVTHRSDLIVLCDVTVELSRSEMPRVRKREEPKKPIASHKEAA